MAPDIRSRNSADTRRARRVFIVKDSQSLLFAAVLGVVAVATGGRWLTHAAAAAPAQVAQAAEMREPADLVLRNGRIVTLDDRVPEARALAARGGRIDAVGSEAEVATYI